MTDLAEAVGNLLAVKFTDAERAPDAGRCRWCGQEWTAKQTVNCRHFGPGAGHCPDCGRQWSGSREAHCAACHRHFSSDSAFDLHQRLDHGPCDANGEHGRICRAVLVCHDPKRLVEAQTDDGPVWSWPRMPADAIAQRKGKS